jgi:hypothetical protein
MPSLVLSTIAQGWKGLPQPSDLSCDIQNIDLYRTAPGTSSDLYRGELVVPNASGTPRQVSAKTLEIPISDSFLIVSLCLVVAQVIIRVLRAPFTDGKIDTTRAKKVSPG